MGSGGEGRGRKPKSALFLELKAPSHLHPSCYPLWLFGNGSSSETLFEGSLQQGQAPRPCSMFPRFLPSTMEPTSFHLLKLISPVGFEVGIDFFQFLGFFPRGLFFAIGRFRVPSMAFFARYGAEFRVPIGALQDLAAQRLHRHLAAPGVCRLRRGLLGALGRG